MAEQSDRAFAEAEQVLVGGVNSPVRAFRAVGGTPPMIARGEGAYLWDIDGKRYIDFVCSWGATILGHADPKIVAAVSDAARRGCSFGAPTESETRLAGMIRDAMPSMERIRFVNSGTEATMSALRVARGATGRDKILKFEGCYHGHADYLLVNAGSGALTLGTPDSAGVPEDFAKHTLVAPYNDLAAVTQLFTQRGSDIAAVIVEPLAGNMGFVRPRAEFLPGLRKLCDAHGALLIFDEVMTGFRVAFGGVQTLSGVTPDLTCLGKVIGGGLPMAAYGGQRAVMEHLAPLGPVYQAGTLAGNPLAMAAGIATIKALTVKGIYQHLSALTTTVTTGIATVLRQHDIPHFVDAEGGMWGVTLQDPSRYPQLFHALLTQGVYMAPSAYEAAFVTLSHTEDTIRRACDCFAESVNTLSE